MSASLQHSASLSVRVCNRNTTPSVCPQGPNYPNTSPLHHRYAALQLRPVGFHEPQPPRILQTLNSALPPRTIFLPSQLNQDNLTP